MKRIKPDDGSRKWLEIYIQHTIAKCFQDTFPDEAYIYESNISRNPLHQLDWICSCYKTVYNKLQKEKERV